MRAYRSLVVGITAATLCIVAIVAWQFVEGGSGLATVGSGKRERSAREGPPDQQASEKRAAKVSPSSDNSASDQNFAAARQRMVEQQLAARDIDNERVLEAMSEVPRHRFVPESERSRAYQDSPLPVGHQQTISQPYIVALMTQVAEPQPTDIALDVGTGSGYQAAILGELCQEVYSIEIVEPLAESAKEVLSKLGYDNVTVRQGDGYRGWPEKAPFDLIIVAAAPEEVPQPLIEQLKPRGRLVIPVGGWMQHLLVLEKQGDGSVERKKIAPVAFVPMTGEAER